MRNLLKTVVVAITVALSLMFGQVSGAAETRVELASGAQRGPGYVSVSQDIITADGTYTLVMGSLKPENRDAVIAALEEHYDPDSTDTLVLVDDAFPDAEKYNSDSLYTGEEADSKKCWAATISDMLWVSGWAERLVNPLTGAPFSSEDDVFQYYSTKFSNGGSGCPAGLDWFFMGEYFEISYSMGHAFLRQDFDTEDGLIKDFVSTYTMRSYNVASAPELISALEDLDESSEMPSVFHAGLGVLAGSILDGKSHHAVNAVGVIIDPTAKETADRYKAIVLIDPDNDGTPLCGTMEPDSVSAEERLHDKEARPNTVTVYNLKWTYDEEGNPCWEIVGYDCEGESSWCLYELTAWPLYDEAYITSNRETEGNCSVATTIDLSLGEAFTTDREKVVIDLYNVDLEDVTVTEFIQGDPIKVNFFVQNRSSFILDEAYLGGAQLTVDWRVTRDADGSTVASGRSACNTPIYHGIEYGSLLQLNEENGENAVWEPGDYTVTLDLNADRAVSEAYYLNNLTREAHFTIVASEEPGEPEEPEEPDEPDDPEEPEGPEEPVEPEPEPYEDPTPTDDPVDPASVPAKNPQTAQSQSKTLPNTGDVALVYLAGALACVGALSCLVGMGLVRIPYGDSRKP